jgi:hypothetical protein
MHELWQLALNVKHPTPSILYCTMYLTSLQSSLKKYKPTLKGIVSSIDNNKIDEAMMALISFPCFVTNEISLVESTLLQGQRLQRILLQRQIYSTNCYYEPPTET